MCDVLPGVVVEYNWSLHVDESTAHTSDLLMHFNDFFCSSFLSYFFCLESGSCNACHKVQTIKHSTRSFLDEAMPSESVSDLDRGPATELNVMIYHSEFTSHHTARFDLQILVIVA